MTVSETRTNLTGKAHPSNKADDCSSPTVLDRVDATEAERRHAKQNQSRREPTFTIGELSEEFSITTRAIRFYEARKLISPQRVGASRVYSKRDRARLKIILRGKNLGFSLEDIAEYLSLYDTDPSQLAQTEMLLGRVHESIANLEKKRADLDRTLADLRGLQERCQEHIRSISDKPSS
ncbi:MAG: MerR family transcriptional regulator [Hyphomicrobiaceae bacterium]